MSFGSTLILNQKCNFIGALKEPKNGTEKKPKKKCRKMVSFWPESQKWKKKKARKKNVVKWFRFGGATTHRDAGITYRLPQKLMPLDVMGAPLK